MIDMRKFSLFLIGLAAFVLLVGECDNLKVFIAIKIASVVLICVFCQLWHYWRMDEDEDVRDYLDD